MFWRQQKGCPDPGPRSESPVVFVGEGRCGVGGGGVRVFPHRCVCVCVCAVCCPNLQPRLDTRQVLLPIHSLSQPLCICIRIIVNGVNRVSLFIIFGLFLG